MKTMVLLLIALLTFIGCSSEKTIGLKQNVHHDDFEYSVQNVEKMESIGNHKPKGVFYIVTFSVENRAKRVTHNWNNSIAYLIDEKGNEYDNSFQEQVNLKLSKDFYLEEKYETPAGITETTMLVFDIPKDVKEPHLKVQGAMLMGDLFDGNQFKNTKIKLY